MDKISIALINSFGGWQQGVLIDECEVIVSRIGAQICEEIVHANSYITKLHNMRAICRIAIDSPSFYLYRPAQWNFTM